MEGSIVVTMKEVEVEVGRPLLLLLQDVEEPFLAAEPSAVERVAS